MAGIHYQIINKSRGFVYSFIFVPSTVYLAVTIRSPYIKFHSLIQEANITAVPSFEEFPSSSHLSLYYISQERKFSVETCISYQAADPELSWPERSVTSG